MFKFKSYPYQIIFDKTKKKSKIKNSQKFYPKFLIIVQCAILHFAFLSLLDLNFLSESALINWLTFHFTLVGPQEGLKTPEGGGERGQKVILKQVNPPAKILWGGGKHPLPFRFLRSCFLRRLSRDLRADDKEEFKVSFEFRAEIQVSH